jgi:hypothetical protein
MHRNNIHNRCKGLLSEEQRPDLFGKNSQQGKLPCKGRQNSAYTQQKLTIHLAYRPELSPLSGG